MSKEVHWFVKKQKNFSFSEHPHSKKHFEMPKIKIKMVLRNLIKATKAPLQLVCFKKKISFFLFLFFKYVISGYQDIPLIKFRQII